MSKVEEEHVEMQKLNRLQCSDLNSNDNQNYIKNVFLKNIKFNILIIILFVCFFILEIFIRKPLFDYSIYF